MTLQKKSMNAIYKQLAKALHPDLEFDPEKRAKKEEQMKRLHDYEIILKDLVGKDAAKEKKSISTLEKLLTAIEWELKNNLLIGKYRKQLQSLIVLLKGKNEQEKGLLFALKEQLTMINSGRVPHSEKIEEIILIEQNFLKEFKWWKE